jgi:hypothetical protein
MLSRWDHVSKIRDHYGNALFDAAGTDAYNTSRL